MKKMNRFSVLMAVCLLFSAISVNAAVAETTGAAAEGQTIAGAAAEGQLQAVDTVNTDAGEDTENTSGGEPSDGQAGDEEGDIIIVDDNNAVTGSGDDEEENTVDPIPGGDDDQVSGEAGEGEEPLGENEPEGLIENPEVDPNAAVPEAPKAAAVAKNEITELTAETIAGFWTIDGITNYRFEENGKGALVLPSNTYRFSFSIEDDEITLNYADKKIGKKVFGIAMEGDTLILTRHAYEQSVDYELYRAEE